MINMDINAGTNAKAHTSNHPTAFRYAPLGPSVVIPNDNVVALVRLMITTRDKVTRKNVSGSFAMGCRQGFFKT